MADQNAEPKYRMTISRMTIEQLGIKLYDKVSAVLAELIANAYDADATEVTITLPLGTTLATKPDGVVSDRGFEITITDNGHGMTPDKINPYYLKVGINRRTRPQGDKTREKHRPVMGRKGIGKLAPFGICRKIEVISAGGEPDRDQYEFAHLILSYKGIVGEETAEPYFPDIGEKDGTFTDKRGTTIILRDFDRRRVPNAETLHRQLAARFGLERPDWKVVVVDSTGDASGFQLRGGSLPVATLPGTEIDVENRPIVLEDGRELPVRGWVAYAREAYKDEVMAGVRIYARGKIVSQTRDFGIPSGFTGEYKLRSYLVGYIEADWIDEEEEDLIRSDRQDIIWNSEKGEAFQKWGRKILRELAAKAETAVKSKVWDEFVEASGIVDKAKEAFPKDRDFQQRVQDVAKLVIRGTSRDSVKDQDYVNRVVDFALSVAPHRALLDNLQEIAAESTKTLDAVVELFGRVRLAELYSLGQVARERVESVVQLQKLIDTATTEHPLQKLLEEAPWLIAPTWTPIVMDRSLERFRRNFEGWYKRKYGEPVSSTTIDRPTKKPDFIFINHPRGLEIVEIKKPRHSLTDKEFERAHGYYKAVCRFLDENLEIAERFPKTRLIIVCESIGCGNAAYVDLIENHPDIEHRTWRGVLHDTLESHDDFLRTFEEAQRSTTNEHQEDGH